MSKKGKTGKKVKGKKGESGNPFQFAAQQMLDYPKQNGGQFITYDPNKPQNLQILNHQGQPQYSPQFIQNPSQLNPNRLNQSMRASSHPSQQRSRINTAGQFGQDLQFKQPLTLDQDFFKENLQNLNQALYGLFKKERDLQIKKDQQKFQQEDRIHRIVSQQQEILTHLIKDLEEDRKRKEREQQLEDIYEQELNQNNYMDRFSENQKKQPNIEDVLEKEMWNFYYNPQYQAVWQFYNMMNPYAQQQVMAQLVSNYLNQFQNLNMGPNMPHFMPGPGMPMPPPPLTLPQNPGMLRPPGGGMMMPQQQQQQPINKSYQQSFFFIPESLKLKNQKEYPLG